MIEWWLSSRWTPAYFRSGIRLFNIEIPYRPRVSAAELADEFRPHFKSSFLGYRAFEAISGHEIAIGREYKKAFSEKRRAGMAIVRGLIETNPLHGTITVKGYLSYSTLFFIIFLLSDPIAKEDTSFFGIPNGYLEVLIPLYFLVITIVPEYIFLRKLKRILLVKDQG